MPLVGTINLWPDDSPHHIKGESGYPRMLVNQPMLREDDDEALPCVLILPGGGYSHLAGHEGLPLAHLVTEHMKVGVVLTYRHKPEYYPAPLADVARAMRLLRSKADEIGIDPQNITILGFSAGGHLASTLCTQPELHLDEHDDLAETVDPRPNRQILCYPVISLTEDHHEGSALCLLGPDQDSPEMRQQLSNDLHVNSKTPPTFLWHTTDDAAVPASNSIRYYQACQAANVPVEMHLYESGEHGLGLAVDNKKLRTWSDLMLRWMNGS